MTVSTRRNATSSGSVPGTRSIVEAGSAPQSAVSPGLPIIPVFLLLFALATVVLTYRIGTAPNVPVNWESYTLRGLIDFARDPSGEVFRLNQGLMTNSGQSIVVIGPASIGFWLFDQSLWGLRLPAALIAALSVPLTWLLGRRLFSDVVGITAALIVGTSHVFVLYGRTGTNVGMSITPALVGFLMLWNCLRPERAQWVRWLIGLQLILIVNSYFYSPIRFLWPIAIVLFMVELAMQRGSAPRFLTSFLVTLVVLPVTLMVLMPGPIVSPVSAVKDYYYGRGEQIFDIGESSNGYLSYLRAETDEERAQLEAENEDDLALKLVRQNATDLLHLLIDRDTDAPNTYYWSPKGRLYSLILVPFFLAGLAILLLRFFREPRARFLLALFFGFSLPLLLTSRVHIGRLVFIVPLLAIIIAVPIGYLTRWLANPREGSRRRPAPVWAGGLLGVIVAAVGAYPTLAYWDQPFPYDRSRQAEIQVGAVMRESTNQQFVYVFGDRGGYEIESLRIANFEILFRDEMRFLDLMTGDERGTGERLLIYGGVLDRLERPESIPNVCTCLYLVDPDVVDGFKVVATGPPADYCNAPLTYVVLE